MFLLFQGGIFRSMFVFRGVAICKAAKLWKLDVQVSGTSSARRLASAITVSHTFLLVSQSCFLVALEDMFSCFNYVFFSKHPKPRNPDSKLDDWDQTAGTFLGGFSAASVFVFF